MHFQDGQTWAAWRSVFGLAAGLYVIGMSVITLKYHFNSCYEGFLRTSQYRIHIVVDELLGRL
jgi:hypothetical protein